MSNGYILTTFRENAFENIVWKMAAFLSRPQCADALLTRLLLLFNSPSRSSYLPGILTSNRLSPNVTRQHHPGKRGMFLKIGAATKWSECLFDIIKSIFLGENGRSFKFHPDLFSSVDFDIEAALH